MTLTSGVLTQLLEQFPLDKSSSVKCFINVVLSLCPSGIAVMHQVYETDGCSRNIRIIKFRWFVVQ